MAAASEFSFKIKYPMFPELHKSYDPKAIEPEIAAQWRQSPAFQASHDPHDPRRRFALVIPPPNVTGSLHMGHMLEHTLIDIVVRHERMQGKNALWLPGTDHAGIATQMVVERELAKEGITRQQLGREAFEKKVWEWKEKSGGTILRQMVRLGASCDWSRERFTLDEGLSRAVRTVFVRLYEEKRIYRGRYIVNWCPRCQTAVSDLEVAHEETTGKLYTVRYQAAEGAGHLEVATTRPETILGDVAVAVNPRDERYQSWIGKKVTVPLAGRAVPVIADEIAQPEFGTGAVKITPSHDANDFAAGQRHHLPELPVIDETGKMTAAAGEYAGLDRFAAREKVAADLEAAGLIAKISDHAMALGRCQRCRTVIEPRVSRQWFVKVGKLDDSDRRGLADCAIAAVTRGHIEFVPTNYKDAYLRWMENIHDWCISRQLWWGHRIPAWYCAQCPDAKPVVAMEAPAQCADCGGAMLQDSDVLDTWFSSALWPFSTLGWPEATADLKQFYPTDLLITGFDILFFWVARMIMMGVHFEPNGTRLLRGAVPFRKVYIHALVRDADKQKMSKTRGNVIDPLAMTEKYGTDAVRFTLAAMAVPGTDIALSEERMAGYAAFANKIWNAARFIFGSLRQLEERDKWDLSNWQNQFDPENLAPQTSDPSDEWILVRLKNANPGKAIEQFRFHEAADALYHFIWNDFCDWYLEMAKIRLSAGGEDARQTADFLLSVWEITLRYLHPFLPFLTEEIWQGIWKDRRPATSLSLAAWPNIGNSSSGRTIAAIEYIQDLQELITQIRSRRAMWKIPPGKKLRLFMKDPWLNPETRNRTEKILKALAGISEVVYPNQFNATGPGQLTLRAWQAQLDLEDVDLSGLKQELTAERNHVQQGIRNLEEQLNNPHFCDRARSEVIVGAQKELHARKTKLEQIEAILRGLKES